MNQESLKYRVSQPQVTKADQEAVGRVLKAGMISSVGPEVREFEEAFAKYNKMKYGVTCNSGTSALYLAMRACDIGPGDEVIIPEFTMIACAYGVSNAGATPVFVDCWEDLNIDTAAIEEAITPRTKAIMPVHIYGRQCEMDVILQIAKRYNLYVIEDCAESHGIMPQGDIACFSLFANKILTSGEGGILVTNSERLAREARHVANLAFDPTHDFLHTKIAHNLRMTNMQAALALSQLSRISDTLRQRKKIEQWYNERLPESIQLPPRDVLWVYDIVTENRDEVREHLAKEGIETRVFFKPMSMQKPYRAPYKHLKAFEFSKQGLYLPTYTDLKELDVEIICEKVREVV